jgi:hypothetical protein
MSNLICLPPTVLEFNLSNFAGLINNISIDSYRIIPNPIFTSSLPNFYYSVIDTSQSKLVSAWLASGSFMW